MVPVTLRFANGYIKAFHRHHGQVRGCKFTIAVQDDDGHVVGVAVVGRPVARKLDDKMTAEVTRLCTDGTPNACSMLYAACWRAAKAMGYRRMVTYILSEEAGVSLKASGWVLVAASIGGGSWSRDGREREDKHPLDAKDRWEVAV